MMKYTSGPLMKSIVPCSAGNTQVKMEKRSKTVGFLNRCTARR